MFEEGDVRGMGGEEVGDVEIGGREVENWGFHFLGVMVVVRGEG